MSDGLELLKPFLPGLEDVLEDPEVSEIMINGPHNVWIEGTWKALLPRRPAANRCGASKGRHTYSPAPRPGPGLSAYCRCPPERRLAGGNLCATSQPKSGDHGAAVWQTGILGRRPGSTKGRCPKNVKAAAERMLLTRRNILVSGGTGSGKTTLLNALIELLPDDERIVAIEDTLELRIEHSNCVRFEARGLATGAVTIRDLVRHALRHRPDHIVVGEVRGGEAADLLQALNTGHGGSLTTVHANNAESALSRLASCAMQGGGELPWEVTCRGVVDGIAMVIHMTRSDGRRFVEEAAFVKGYEAAGNRWLIEPIKRDAACEWD